MLDCMCGTGVSTHTHTFTHTHTRIQIQAVGIALAGAVQLRCSAQHAPTADSCQFTAHAHRGGWQPKKGKQRLLKIILVLPIFLLN